MKRFKLLTFLVVCAIALSGTLLIIPAVASGDEQQALQTQPNTEGQTNQDSQTSGSGVEEETPSQVPSQARTNEAPTVPITNGEIAVIPSEGANQQPQYQSANDGQDSSEEPAEEAPMPAESTIDGQAHVQNIGWTNWDSAQINQILTLGTTGKSLRMEAIRLELKDADGSILVNPHVQNKGWLGWISQDSIAGTTGQALRLEAICIQLTGDGAERFDIYYRVHSERLGWLGWVKNGESAGTQGCAWRAEAIQIVLVNKGERLPDGAETSSLPGFVEKASVTYQAHVQNIGWQAWKTNGQLAGTTGKSLRIEAVRAEVTDQLAGSITYQAHVQNIGWQNWMSASQIAGTTGRSLRVEALRFKLTGDLSKYFDIYYRVHIQEIGWLGWAKNGEAAGSTGIAARAEGVEIKIVAKGSAAPGTTKGALRTAKLPSTIKAEKAKAALANANRYTGAQGDMNRKAQGYTSRTKWLVLIDNANCRVGIFSGSRGNWVMRYYWLVSNGAPWTPTRRGDFTIGSRGYVFGNGYSCYYWTQFSGDYLFHSILYNQGTRTVQDGRLGLHISHGCIRMNIDQAKWIYDNLPSGTRVISYN